MDTGTKGKGNHARGKAEDPGTQWERQRKRKNKGESKSREGQERSTTTVKYTGSYPTHTNTTDKKSDTQTQSVPGLSFPYLVNLNPFRLRSNKCFHDITSYTLKRLWISIINTPTLVGDEGFPTSHLHYSLVRDLRLTVDLPDGTTLDSGDPLPGGSDSTGPPYS